jgi:integrase/recombinase XerD
VATDQGARDFEPVLRAYLRVRRAQGFTWPSTGASLHRLFRHLERAGVDDLRQVREAHLVSFVRRLQQSKGRAGERLSPWTVSNYVNSVRVFFAYLAERGVIFCSPARELPLPQGNHLPHAVLTPEQARRLVETPSPLPFLTERNRAILELFYATGIRVNECARLDVSDVDLALARMVVRTGKGRKDRIVPLYGRAAAAIEIYLRDVRPRMVGGPSEAALFVTQQGRRIGTEGLQLVVARAALAAGIRGPVHPHALRHSCATHLLKGGADIRHVQALLGHRSSRTTAKYTRVEASDLREVIARCHPRERRVR